MRLTLPGTKVSADTITLTTRSYPLRHANDPNDPSVAYALNFDAPCRLGFNSTGIIVAYTPYAHESREPYRGGFCDVSASEKSYGATRVYGSNRPFTLYMTKDFNMRFVITPYYPREVESLKKRAREATPDTEQRPDDHDDSDDEAYITYAMSRIKPSPEQLVAFLQNLWAESTAMQKRSMRSRFDAAMEPVLTLESAAQDEEQ